MQKIIKEIYITSDNSEFNSEKEAEFYESELILNKTVEKLKNNILNLEYKIKDLKIELERICPHKNTKSIILRYGNGIEGSLNEDDYIDDNYVICKDCNQKVKIIK